MIYDCFPFFNELDVLDIRLNTLNDVVDKFVLVEAAFTHTGKPKELIFEANKERFSAFLGKIIHIKLTEKPEPPPGGTEREQRWFLENFQRNQIIQGLVSARPDDTIMISDCDEIPDPAIVERLPKIGGISRFKPRAYYYYLNLRNCTSPFFGNGTVALTYGKFTDPATYQAFPYQVFVPIRYNSPPTATLVRYLDADKHFKAGWHFSYIGGVQAIKRKINSTADGNDLGMANMPEEEIECRMRRGEDLFGRGDRFIPEPIDKLYPKYILDNQKLFSRLVLPATREECAALRLHKWKELARGFITRFPQEHFYPFAGALRRKIKRVFCTSKIRSSQTT